MPTNLRVIHHADFLRARPDGQVDLDMAQRALAEIAHAAGGLGDFHLLVDIRNLSGSLTPAELHELAASLLPYGETFMRKTAVLCPRERFDHARFFSLLAASHGFTRIRAFLSYEDAMEWVLLPPRD